MTNDPVHKLAALLETVPSPDRQEITAWLLRTGRVPTWPDPAAEVAPDLVASVGHIAGHARLRQIGGAPTAGEGSQLVTIRLPAEGHARLRQWCAEHGFTMATVVRGLVERFLAQEGSTGTRPDPDPS
jgi:hypothetical protein